MDALDEARKAVKEARLQVDATLDSGVETLSSVLKEGVRDARALGEKQMGKAKEIADIGAGHLESTDALMFSKLKEGIDFMVANPNESMAAGAGLLLVALPGPRGILYRSTLGRFRSEEAIYRSSQRQVEALKAALETTAAEAKALSEAKTAALEKATEAQRALSSTGWSLERLGSGAASAEAKATGLVSELRKLKGEDALKLRMEIAELQAGLTQQRRAIDRDFRQLLRKGVV